MEDKQFDNRGRQEMKITQWDKRKEKKARFKKKLSRLKKRGCVYGGYVILTDEIKLSSLL